jgi:hypothetical protein
MGGKSKNGKMWDFVAKRGKMWDNRGLKYTKLYKTTTQFSSYGDSRSLAVDE